MEFEIENLEDVIKEVIADVSQITNSAELNEVYNRDIESLYVWLFDEADAGECDDYGREFKVLYMPRSLMRRCVDSFYYAKNHK